MMEQTSAQDAEFLRKLDEVISANLQEEGFGVAELAEILHMSRSNLLRKVKKITNAPVTQRISTARLEKAMYLLRNSSYNVTEVSYQVGFSSTSYFIKCFREQYGYPPGETANYPEVRSPITPEIQEAKKSFLQSNFIWFGVLLLVGTLALWILLPDSKGGKEALEKSILVLPFKNDSADSTNQYMVNGLMDAVLNNLQTIKDLKVLSRTSSEKYRNVVKTIPELVEELQVNYIVEGSGQKIGDRIVLNIQLVDGRNEKQLWGKQYRRAISDIFILQQEIAKDIAEGIEATITPDEKSRIEKVSTQNLDAYDDFLKGYDLMNLRGDSNLLQSIRFFQSAIAKDENFALAYACAGMSYYYLDFFKMEKKYSDTMEYYADKAMLLDAESPASYIVKTLYYFQKKEYLKALPYLEKGLELNPNTPEIISLLADYYGAYIPNTSLYLKYALKGIKLGTSSKDSTEICYQYVRLGNALIQSGFVDEAIHYLNKSLAYNANNPFSNQILAFANFAKNKDISITRRLLENEFQKDTNRFDILKDIGKVCYYQRDFKSAYQYFERFNRYRENFQLDVYEHENMIIGYVYEQMGKIEAAKKFNEGYKAYIEKDQTPYKSLGLAMYYSHYGDKNKALSNFQLFTKEDHIQYWVILFLEKDPLIDQMKKHPELRKILKEIERKFWANHQILKEQLTEENLL
ncbi:MAG TPA: helix-turn-helix domain-containing protein [Saprospiraceae bacterium]|nr:helix-turn-helix domain-containing protein [Saprospiraceae bacterium]HPN71330.1 helix-turn-helix domain-containing protein [Saprospiraceae bacterium]